MHWFIYLYIVFSERQQFECINIFNLIFLRPFYIHEHNL